MWVFPEPVRRLALPALFMLHAIAGFMAIVIEIICPQCFFKPIAYGIGEPVPPPFGLRTERYTLGIPVGDGLQSGHIYREGKCAIAAGQRRQRIDGRVAHILPEYDRLAVVSRMVITTRWKEGR